MIDVEMLRPTADEMLSGLSADDAMKRRILFQADAVEKMPAIAGEMLGGLTATPALRHRILVKADRIERANAPRKEAAPARQRRGFARYTPAIGMALALVVMIGLGGYYGSLPTAQPVPGPVIAQNDLGSGMAGGGGEAGTVPQFRSLYAPGEGANPPLIGVNGRYYRMLNVPVQSSVVGTQIAEVQDFTDEPSLATTVGVVSNVAKMGTPVYAVDGISHKTACIAEVDGVPRLFQRVGYASNTVIGGELFEDTLDINNQVVAMELSGVGTIVDESLANELAYTLTEFAVSHGGDSLSGSDGLIIYLRNGLSLQLMVDGDLIGGCGTWSCPEFFESFREAI